VKVTLNTPSASVELEATGSGSTLSSSRASNFASLRVTVAATAFLRCSASLSADLHRRLEQHRNGKNYSTRRLGLPLELIVS
jgi:hypothetical protein